VEFELGIVQSLTEERESRRSMKAEAEVRG
jgi:hypothetical protein